MKINKEWCQSYRMPTNAIKEQRIAWHLEPPEKLFIPTYS
jgi:hypothetical protein